MKQPELSRPSAAEVKAAVLILARELAWTEYAAEPLREVEDHDSYAASLGDVLAEKNYGPDEIVIVALDLLDIQPYED